jgi:hypothetical protein
MNKQKILLWAVVILVLSNLLLVTVFGLHLFETPPHERPRKIVIERLQFTPKQIKQYDLLIADHRAKIHDLDEKILANKTALYKDIANGNKNLNDSINLEIGKLQMEVEKVHYQHFQAIQNLCEPSQLPLFKKLLNDIAQIFSKPKPKH